ncbi:MAG: hypothetical protein AAB343_04300, partial [Patescibacteria group bacterium]
SSTRVGATVTATTTTTTSIEPDEIDVSATGDGTEKKGNVEINWKVEEGSKSNTGGTVDGVTPGNDPEPVTPDFGILLGGGNDNDDSESNTPAATEEGRAEVAKIILADLIERGVPVQSVLINSEKVETKVEHRVKLLALFSVNTTATVEIDANEQVKVKFPWWAFLASGKDKEGVGDRVFTAISNVLKTKHDTVKNSIGNIR